MRFSSNSSFQSKTGKKNRKNINVFSNIEHKPSVSVHSLNEKLQDKFPESVIDATPQQAQSVAKPKVIKNRSNTNVRQYDLNNIEESLPAEKRNAKHFHAEGYYSLHYLLKKNQEKYGKELILPESHNLSEKQIKEFLQSECELEVTSQIADLEEQELQTEKELIEEEVELIEPVVLTHSNNGQQEQIKQYLFPEQQLTEEIEEDEEWEAEEIEEDSEDEEEKPEYNIDYHSSDFPSFLHNKPYTTVNMNAHNLITEKSSFLTKVQDNFPLILFSLTILAGLILFFPDIQIILSKLIG